MSSKVVPIFLAFMVASIGGLSIPAGAVSLSERFLAEVEYKATTYTCGSIGGMWSAGTYKSATGDFQTYSDKLKKARKKAKKASGAAKAKLRKLIKRLVVLEREGAEACVHLQSQPPAPSTFAINVAF